MPMEQNLEQRLAAQDAKLDAIFSSVEKMRKYLLITVWITVLMVVVPALGLVFVIPMFLNSYMGSMAGLI